MSLQRSTSDDWTMMSNSSSSRNAQRHVHRRLSDDWTPRKSGGAPFASLETPDSNIRHTFRKYDVSGTMNRLRSSMVGGDVRQALLDSSLAAEQTHQVEEEETSDRMVKTFDFLPTQTRALRKRGFLRGLSAVAGQIPAIVLIGLFHLMIGIPFGVSYFPIGWRNGMNDGALNDTDDQGIRGPFPLPGKEALGIRMFLCSTIIGQVVFTLCSGFVNPIGLQMVENVPFTHALSNIVIRQQGYGMDSLSTLFVMFGLASILVGGVFYTLGRLRLGRVVYYFPTHVLVGCIGGIGLYLCKTGFEVTLDAALTMGTITRHMDLVGFVLFFELVLRLLERITRDRDGKQKYSLLSPIYFCMITPVFYVGLWIFSVDMDDAIDAGYFFPPLQEDDADDSASMLNSIFNEDLFDIWRVINPSVVSWKAIVDSIPTLLALTLFSLIHVPINIPAFALSTNTDADMNKELLAHGYSNMIAGVCGGLQNYMAYTQSVLYDRSGGRGKASGMAVAALTTFLFFVGPTIASYIPRCMAGTLLLHVGIDLFLEGVYDSYGKFDNMEYGSIWLIIIVMTLRGMDAAMITGVITAVSTYVVQNMTYVNPVRGSMSATTLRSSKLNRTHQARAILDDPRTGRGRILVVQLQGHLFFGNMAHLSESMSRLISEKRGTEEDEPLIVILDFSLVLGIDSSAAQAMVKLKSAMQKQYYVKLCIFVSGSEAGFPCEFNLSKELSSDTRIPRPLSHNDVAALSETAGLLMNHLSSSRDALIGLTSFLGSHVCDSLDTALVYAEDALIAYEDPSPLGDLVDVSGKQLGLSEISSLSEERAAAERCLENLCPGPANRKDIELLFSKFEREMFQEGDVLWKQGSASTCMKLLVRGTLTAILENEAGTSEPITSGNTIGELGLVEGIPRMSSVMCVSQDAVAYSLSQEAYAQLIQTHPHATRLVDLICVRYLSARVQHVSNRIFETRCLPI